LNTETIHIPNAPAIPGLTFRYFRGASDYPNVKAVFDTCRVVDGTAYTLTLEDIAHHFEHLQRSNPFTDMIFAEVDGQPIAYGRVGWYQEENSDYIYYGLGWVDPAWRRKGIGTAILMQNERRIREIAAEHPPEATKFIQNDHNDLQIGVAALLKANGYAAVRWGYRMIRPVSDPLPVAPMPAGLQVRPATADHTRQIWDALNDAFSDSWGFVRGTDKDYERWLTSPTFDPSLWKVGWEGGEVAGMVLNFFNQAENQDYGRKRGWTDPICVRKPWRRRGLARALLVQSIEMFRHMGFDETALGVDTQNPNHALNLYESVGYKIVRKGTTYRKPLDIEVHS
jgi:mycothiol synthase